MLFREWNNIDYDFIARGVVSDRVIVPGDANADSLALLWYTVWEDSARARRFMDNYVLLAEQKYGIDLPSIPATDSLLDHQAGLNFYIEQYQKTNVILIEHYPAGAKAAWLAALRQTGIGNWPVAKRAAVASLPSARIDKTGIRKKICRDWRSAPPGDMRSP